MTNKFKNNSYSLSEKNIGFIYGLLAFIIWGLLPLYWNLLSQVSALEILAHRIFWSFIFVLSLLVFTKRIKELKNVLKDKKLLCLTFLSSIILSLNWYTFIWGVNSGYIVEVSLGYYINPLIVIFMGIIILKEKCSVYEYIAIGLAFIGVCIMTFQYGRIPWIALALAFSFAIYGLMKKLVKLEATLALAIETATITPIALGFIILKQIQGTGYLLSGSILTTMLLIFSGLATGLPLLLFAKGTQKSNLSTIGFLQYIAPTLNLYIGVFIFKESFTHGHLLSFGFIWVALIIYSLSIVINVNSKKNYVKKGSQRTV